MENLIQVPVPAPYTTVVVDGVTYMLMAPSVLRKALALRTAPTMELSDAEVDVLAERRRQVQSEGWTAAHDDQYQNGELAKAAACYARHAGSSPEKRAEHADAAKPDPIRYHPTSWPWPGEWWKPSTPLRELAKAGALILADMERRYRAGETE